METPRPKVPTLEVALVIIATFFVFLFLSALSLLALGDQPTLIIGELLILIVPLIYLLFKRIDVKKYVRIDISPKSVLIGLAGGGLLLLLNIVVSDLLTTLLGQSQAVQQSNDLITSLSSSASGLAAVVISLALAGICEEFAFRGFLQNSLTRNLKEKSKSKYAFVPGMIIAALIFGLFHFDPQGVYTISAFIAGLALGYIYYRWNYVASATAHASMNLIVLAFLLLGI